MVGFNISLIPLENQAKYTIPRLIRMYIRTKLTFKFLEYSFNQMVNQTKSLFKKKEKEKSPLPFLSVKPFDPYQGMKYGQLKNCLDQIENMPRIEKEIEQLYKLKDDIENFDDKTNSKLKLNEMKIEFEELFMKAYNKAVHKKKKQQTFRDCKT